MGSKCFKERRERENKQSLIPQKLGPEQNIECGGASERLLVSKPHDSEKRAPIFSHSSSFLD